MVVEPGMLCPIQQSVQVTYKYSVYFTTSLFACENTLLRDVVSEACNQKAPGKLLCVVDRSVWQTHPYLQEAILSYCQHHSSALELVCAPLIIDGGEEVKNDLESMASVQESIHRYGICRHSYVLAIGGGALLDMVGYAAATAHRGVRLIRVPTTVLAQCDSGVGVKNSVNAFGKKNFLGTFAPPVAVLNDADFLTTLSLRDWRSGIAEAIKVALLKDAEFFASIEREAERLMRRDGPAMHQLIYRCAQLHLEHIATGGDPFELGSSRPLDFGHWAAHKLEQLSHYTLRHGEAVAIGLALDVTYSYLKGFLPLADWRRILQLLMELGFAISMPVMSQHLQNPRHIDCLLSGLNEFREHLGGQLTIILLERIGKGSEVNNVDEVTMIEGISLLATYQATHARGEFG